MGNDGGDGNEGHGEGEGVINMRVTMMMVMDTGGDTPAQISQ